MKKFKINRDSNKKAEPTAEQIKKYKDFASVAHGYQRLTKRPKKPLYKDPKLFIFLLIIALVFLLMFWDNNTPNKTKSNPSSTSQDSLLPN